MATQESSTLSELFLRSCETHKTNIAYNYRPKFRTLSWTYDDLRRHAFQFAEILKSRDIQQGDRVIIIAYNSPFWSAAFFGIQLRGAIAVPLSPESNEDFIEKVAAQTEAKLIFRSILVSLEKTTTPSIPIENTSTPENLPSLEVPNIKEDDLAEIVYTSGTTGNPKGVMLSHKNLLSNLRAAQAAIPVDSSCRFVSILPLFHMFEQMGGLLVPLAAGAQVSHAASVNPNHLRRIFQDDKPNRMLAVPEFLRLIYLRLKERAAEEGKLPLLQKMLKLADPLPMPLRKRLFGKIHRTFGWKMHSVAAGGAPLEREVGDFWERIGVYILQGYGLTETSPLLAVNQYNDRKIDSVGKPAKGVEIKIAEDGEVLAKGPNIFQGYWREPEKTKEMFTEDGWFKTGDIGEFDSDGHVHLKGRKKFMIVRASGDKVHPEDLEFELNKEEGVVDSAIITFPQNGDEEIHAVLLLSKENGRDPKNIISRVNDRLIHYQRIASFSIWPHEDFPRTPTRKVKRHEVKPAVEELRRQGTGQTDQQESAKEASRLERIVARVSEVPLEQIRGETKIVEDLNLDSLKRVELVARIEALLNVEIDEGEITPETTVGDLEKLAKERKNKQIRYPFDPGMFKGSATLLRAILQILLLKPFQFLFAPTTVRGLEHIQALQGNPALFFANHTSPADPLLVYAALPFSRRKRTTAAAAIDVLYEPRESEKWIRRWGGFAKFLFAAFPIARRKGQTKSSLEYMGRIIDKNFSVLFFPEGITSRTGELLPLQEGAGLTALEMHVPIVPVKIEGASNVIKPDPEGDPATFKMPKRSRVTITFGKPFRVNPTMNYQEATEYIQEKMKEL